MTKKEPDPALHSIDDGWADVEEDEESEFLNDDDLVDDDGWDVEPSQGGAGDSGTSRKQRPKRSAKARAEQRRARAREKAKARNERELRHQQGQKPKAARRRTRSDDGSTEPKKGRAPLPETKPERDVERIPSSEPEAARAASRSLDVAKIAGAILLIAVLAAAAWGIFGGR